MLPRRFLVPSCASATAKSVLSSRFAPSTTPFMSFTATFSHQFRFCTTSSTTSTSTGNTSSSPAASTSSSPVPPPPSGKKKEKSAAQSPASSSTNGNSNNNNNSKNATTGTTHSPTPPSSPQPQSSSSSSTSIKNLKIPPPGLATGSHSSSTKSQKQKQQLQQQQRLQFLRAQQRQGVPSGLITNRKGRLRSRSPSLTPAAAREAARRLASLKLLKEQSAKIGTKKTKPPQPNFETGENVKGLWGIYLRFLHRSPILAVFVTSLLLWSIGDAASQAIEHQLRAKNVEEAVDMLESGAVPESAQFQWRRFFGAITDGSLIAGVGGYYWYLALDKFVTKTCLLRRGTTSFIMTKMLLEFVVWHPLNLLTFWMVVGFAEGDGLMNIMNELKDDFLPTLAGEYMLWGPLDLLNFWIVPVHLQVILCNVGALFESVFLSYVRSQGFPGFPEPNYDSLEDRSMPVGVIDVLRATDVAFERAIRDGAERFSEIDLEDKGYITAEDIRRFMQLYNSQQAVLAEESSKSSDLRLLPGIPSARATETSAELLEKHARKKGQITRREYLRFIGELNHAAYRTSLLPEVAFTLFDTTERHMITGSSLIELAHLLHDSPEGKQTVKLMMPALEALRSKELTVDEASAVLQGLDTLSKFHKGDETTVVVAGGGSGTTTAAMMTDDPLANLKQIKRDGNWFTSLFS